MRDPIWKRSCRSRGQAADGQRCCAARCIRAFSMAVLTASAVLLAGCGSRKVEVTQVRLDTALSPDSESAEDFSAEGASQAGPDSGPAADSGAEGASQAGQGAEPTADSGAEGAAQTASARSSEGPVTIAVYVCGAVKSPGVYHFPEGSRVIDAIEAAGGFAADADTEWLNQARILADSEMLIVYTASETARMSEAGIGRGSGNTSKDENSGQDAGGASAGGASASGDGASGLVNLNTATKEELMTLPGIGESKADAIIRYREEKGGFASPEDVMNISGIKTSVFSKIQDQITV